MSGARHRTIFLSCLSHFYLCEYNQSFGERFCDVQHSFVRLLFAVPPLMDCIVPSYMKTRVRGARAPLRYGVSTTACTISATPSAYVAEESQLYWTTDRKYIVTITTKANICGNVTATTHHNTKYYIFLIAVCQSIASAVMTIFKLTSFDNTAFIRMCAGLSDVGIVTKNRFLNFICKLQAQHYSSDLLDLCFCEL